jgi:hypothetical protein
MGRLLATIGPISAIPRGYGSHETVPTQNLKKNIQELFFFISAHEQLHH